MIKKFLYLDQEKDFNESAERITEIMDCINSNLKADIEPDKEYYIEMLDLLNFMKDEIANDFTDCECEICEFYKLHSKLHAMIKDVYDWILQYRLNQKGFYLEQEEKQKIEKEITSRYESVLNLV